MSDENKITDPRTVNMLGVDVNIADILGDKLVNQFVAQMTPEQTKALFDHVSQDLFTVRKQLNENGDWVEKIEIRTKRKDRWGHEVTDGQVIGEYIRNRFNDRIKEELVEAVNKIIDSGSYQETVDELASELVQYATEGYKEDLKERIKERLVNNVVDPTMYVNGVSIRGIVHEELSRLCR